jgi:hypothetical protein
MAVNGRLHYVRNGQKIAHGWFGGGLVEAVGANDEAEDAARTYFRRNAAGQILYMASAVLVLNAFSFGYRPDNDSDVYAGFTTGGLVLMGVATVTLGTGTVLYGSAQSYRYDAMNIYNSGVAR